MTSSSSATPDQLTPRQIVAELDRHIVGQAEAKRAVAVAVRNRWRRQQLTGTMRQDVSPKNILMVGPTGVGKTEIARRLATLTGAPFIKVEATKYTEVGYHGRDVESMIRDLLDAAINLVKLEQTETVKEQAGRASEDRLLDLLLPGDSAYGFEDDEAKERRERTREKLRAQLRAGELEERTVEITTEERPNVMNMLGSAGMDLDVSLQGMFEKMMPTRRDTRKMRVADAGKVLSAQAAEGMVDQAAITQVAIERVEQAGIVFIDEIDKIAAAESKSGPDVSRGGVQRDLLPIVEGSTVTTKHGPVRTDHILFIAAGAFHQSDPDDLMPELQGRFPIQVELSDLTKEDLVRILTEPENALTKQTIALLATDGINVEFTGDAVEALAQAASDANRKQQNIGARRLYAILEKVFEQISFDAPDATTKDVRVTGAYVRERLAKGWK
jgi:ATP-dependent HslUV protease ATP-binding subunit HslU